MGDKITVSRGFAEAERPQAAVLFWQAFSEKLGAVLGPRPRALQFLASAFRPENALCARSGAGRLVGLAGLHGAKGGLVGGTFAELAAVYGWVGAAWRGPLLDTLERRPTPGTLLMDGLVVDRDFRGYGIGTRLLDGVVDEARARGDTAVRLDVIDANDRARALYLRYGFVPVGRQRLGPLRIVFGFRSAESLVRTVEPADEVADP